MFASKYNNCNSIYQLSQQQQYNLNNSIDSNASYNSTSNSLLTAANTIVFNNSSTSLSSSSFTSPSSVNNQLLSPQSLLYDNHVNKSNLSNNIIDYQHNNNELDFDLHVINSETGNKSNFKFSNDLNNQILFKVDEDDDDIFINDQQDDDQFDNEDEIDTEENTNPSIISLNNVTNNRMKDPKINSILNPNTTSILQNKLTSFQLNKTLAVNFPTDNQLNGLNINNEISALKNQNSASDNLNQNNNENNQNDANSNTKSNFSYQNNSNIESLSPSSAINLASTTPSNQNGNLTDSTPQNSVKYNTTRTYMKMQLMKKQTEEMEKKAALINHHNSSNIFSSSSSATSNTSLQNGILNSNDLAFAAQNNNQNFSKNAIKNNLSLSSNNDLNMPSSLPSAEIIPKNVLSEVFHIESKLEYPTKYHVMQIAKNLQQSASKSTLTSPNKVKKTSKMSGLRLSGKPSSYMNNNSIQQKFLLQQHQQQQQAQNQYFLSISSKNNSNNENISFSDDISILPNGSSAYSDYVIDQFSNQSYDSRSSSWNQTRSPTDSSFSQNDLLSELDDIVPEELNSYIKKKRIYGPSNLTNQDIQDEINQIELTLNIANTLPNDGMNQLMSPPTAPSVRPSTSCPADLARIKKLQSLNMNEDDIKLYLKERQKKDNHNMIERRRRFNINDRIKELGTILPKNSSDVKLNKGSILKASVDYIKYLETELNKSKQIDEKFHQMTLLNRQLINKIKELEIKSSSNTNINNNNNNMQDVSKPVESIKQEPQISIINLINSNNFDTTDFILNDNNHNNKPFKNHLSINQSYMNKQILSNTSKLEPVKVNGFKNNLDEDKILEEIFNSPSNKQNDPFLGHFSNNYDENIMDSFN